MTDNKRNQGSKKTYNSKRPYSDQAKRGAKNTNSQSKSWHKPKQYNTRSDNKSLIFGRNVVVEAIKANRKIKKLYVTSNVLKDIPVINVFSRQSPHLLKTVDTFELDKMVNGVHQGVVAEVEQYKFLQLDEALPELSKKKRPLVLILDQLTDPHNLGAILRSADATQVDAVIIPKHRSVSITPTVIKQSVGAVEHVKIIQVTNIVQTIKKLKDNRFWIVGADASSSSRDYRQMDVSVPLALVIGSEGKGISQSVKKACDMLVHIPMRGKINSLNASVATAIVLYEIFTKRNPLSAEQKIIRNRAKK